MSVADASSSVRSGVHGVRPTQAILADKVKCRFSPHAPGVDDEHTIEKDLERVWDLESVVHEVDLTSARTELDGLLAGVRLSAVEGGC